MPFFAFLRVVGCITFGFGLAWLFDAVRRALAEEAALIPQVRETTRDAVSTAGDDNEAVAQFFQRRRRYYDLTADAPTVCWHLPNLTLGEVLSCSCPLSCACRRHGAVCRDAEFTDPRYPHRRMRASAERLDASGHRHVVHVTTSAESVCRAQAAYYAGEQCRVPVHRRAYVNSGDGWRLVENVWSPFVANVPSGLVPDDSTAPTACRFRQVQQL